MIEGLDLMDDLESARERFRLELTGRRQYLTAGDSTRPGNDQRQNDSIPLGSRLQPGELSVMGFAVSRSQAGELSAIGLEGPPSQAEEPLSAMGLGGGPQSQAGRVTVRNGLDGSSTTSRRTTRRNSEPQSTRVPLHTRLGTPFSISSPALITRV